MSDTIKIGTRDSDLALWQAKVVKQKLEYLGHKTKLVLIKSQGDLVLNKPIYELGITGVFTKNLDSALLDGKIDIAVHSLKDVPTQLPKGIVQSAVLKRGNANDILVFKNNEEFLSAEHAVIATGSLRRRAQWLNRYPTHHVLDLRGNVNTRLQKLKDNTWNGAIFAAAGVGRLGITPKQSVTLDWMIPAPAQGAVMVATLQSNVNLIEICAEINDKETEICTTIEREFLRQLEGGCTAPIGALAYIKNEEIHFKGVLLSPDGSKRIDVNRTEKLGEHKNIAFICANFIIERGGKRLLKEKTSRETTVYSTKSLTEQQQQLFKGDFDIKSSDFIKINLNRIPLWLLKEPIEHVIITSKNAVDALLTNCTIDQLKFKNIYCVGRRTKRYITQKIGYVTHSENSAVALANYLKTILNPKEEVTYFCSNLRLDDLPDILTQNNVKVRIIEAYQTKLDGIKIADTVKYVMFYSPSAVTSFIKKNTNDITAFCIGETTAKAARKYFKTVLVSQMPTVEHVIDLVNMHLKSDKKEYI